MIDHRYSPPGAHECAAKCDYIARLEDKLTRANEAKGRARIKAIIERTRAELVLIEEYQKSGAAPEAVRAPRNKTPALASAEKVRDDDVDA